MKFLSDWQFKLSSYDSSSLIQYSDKDPSVPSVYFIGKDGNPLDIIKGNDDLSKLSTRIDCILSKAGLVIKSGKETTLKIWFENI